MKLILVLGLLGLPIVVFFAWAFEMTPEGIKRDHEVDKSQSITHETGKKLNLLIIAMLVIALGLSLWHGNFSQSNTSEQLTAEAANQSSESNNAQADSDKIEKVIPIAVLPFVNMSKDPEQEYFVDGLTEELLNSFTRVKGLKVTSRTSSFEYKNKNTDIRTIAEQLGVDYIVEGSVRKSGEDLRITVQLIEAESGSHLLSDTFDRKLVNVFVLQEEISEQIAAALNLKLVLQDDRYDSALEKLDYLAVEKLVEARALIAEFAEEPVAQALKTLNILNEQYPNTAEILGLLAYGYMIEGSVGSITSLDDDIILAKQTLELNSKNLDALITLAVIYDDFPQFIEQAESIYQTIVRYYPGEASSYTRLLSFKMGLRRPCKEIDSYLKTIPEGVLEAQQLAEYEFMLSYCLNPKLLEAGIDKLSELPDSRLVRRDHDALYNLNQAEQRFQQNPNQRFASVLMFFYSYSVPEKLTELMPLINFNRVGYWPVYATASAYKAQIDIGYKPLDFITSYESIIQNGTNSLLLPALVEQGVKEERIDELEQYLKNVPEFEISTDTLFYVEGLFLLQYHTGHKAEALQTAQTALDKILEYKQKHPSSYRYWQLYYSAFLFAVYAEQPELALTILNQDFHEHAAYWLFDPSYERFILKDYAHYEAVQELFRRVDASRAKVRKQLGYD
jgi:TolB-like protein